MNSQRVLRDVACSHGSDRAQGNQWMFLLCKIKARISEVSDTAHQCPSYVPSINFLSSHASLFTKSLIFPTINTYLSPHSFSKKHRMIERKQRKESCNFYYQFSHKLSVLSVLCALFSLIHKIETDLYVSALTLYKYMSGIP